MQEKDTFNESVSASDKVDSNENIESENEQKEEVIYCSKCGYKNSTSSKFCSNCGNSLKSIEDNIKDATKNIKKAINNNETYKNFTSISYSECGRADWENTDMINFIQKKPEYYIPKFKEIQDLNKSTSWNWASFFFSSSWFLYRKMYAIGFGIIVLELILGFIPIVGPICGLVVAILSGLYGNIQYLKFTQAQLESVSTLKEDIKQRILLSKGGVNIVLPVAICIIWAIVIFVVFFLGTLLMMYSPYYY